MAIPVRVLGDGWLWRCMCICPKKVCFLQGDMSGRDKKNLRNITSSETFCNERANGDTSCLLIFELSITLLVAQNLVYTPTLVIHMGKPATFTLNWGIISAGGISTSFAQGLLVDLATRNTKDINHKIVAVGARSIQSAQAFIDQLNDRSEGKSWAWEVKNGVLDGVKARCTYEEVYNNPVRNLGSLYVLQGLLMYMLSQVACRSCLHRHPTCPSSL